MGGVYICAIQRLSLRWLHRHGLLYFLQHGKKVACGSSEGTIYLFNWNGFGATSDRFALRAESIDCMVPVTESLLCTGSTDGIIR